MAEAISLVQEKEMPLPRTTLWRLRKEGLPFVLIGRRIYYRTCSVEEWLKSREQSFSSVATAEHNVQAKVA